MAINYSYHITRLVTDDSSDSPNGAVNEIYGYLYGIDENGKNTTESFRVLVPFTKTVYKNEERTFTDENGETITDENGEPIIKVITVEYVEPIEWNDFIPFENLTQTIVNGWIDSLLSDEEKSGLKLRLSKKIELMYALQSENGDSATTNLPWSIESTPFAAPDL